MEEDWSYFSEDKALSFEQGMDLHNDVFPPTNTKLLIGFDQKPFYDFEQNALISDTEAVQSMEMMMPLYGCDSHDQIPTIQQDESGSSISNQFIELERSISSLIDLSRSMDEGARIAKPICQVYGCDKDLSCSKNYHRRHRVCELHSKKPKVMVNGVERRFCQQCSRFHLLWEFDGEKRSCRRRLAGHNERRRKSRLLGLARKPSQGYNRTSAKKPTILSQDLIPFHHTLCAESAKALSPHGFMDAKPYCSDGSSSGKAPAFQEHPSVSMSSSSSSGGGASSRALSLLSTDSQDLYQSHDSNRMMHCSHAMGDTGLARPDTMILYQDPELLNGTNACVLSEPESTVDLLQLSSHLRRVEQQRSFLSFPDSYNVESQ